MTVQEKLTILADAAKYDASCASSGSDRGGGKIGNTVGMGICHSWAADGRCVSLLKILMTNACVYDCAYCPNRRSNDRPRATFTPQEIAELTMAFYRRNYIEGLFLSSGVLGTPDATMERLISAMALLRTREGFGGYIHVKAIPGASAHLLEQAGLLADRVSVNIELPSRESLRLLAPDKEKTDILQPMRYLQGRIAAARDERRLIARAPAFAPGGQSTQLIVGASPDNDRQIVQLSGALYNRYALRRVYYSAYVPVNKGNLLPDLPRPPLLREHRLYQCDFLMRQYGFAADEILPECSPWLDPLLDPKAAWALRNLQGFPLDVNRADYEALLRVPGIGRIGAQRIVQARRVGSLSLDDVKRMGIVMKRARYFITARGRDGHAGLVRRPEALYAALTAQESAALPGGLLAEQLTLFPHVDALPMQAATPLLLPS